MIPRIAIIGAGPGGLTLGLLLHQAAIPFTIYEKRARYTAAQLSLPSGMLDLHDESGLRAIRACGLYDKFLPHTADCQEFMRILNKDGTVTHEYRGRGARPEISRHSLIDIFLSSIPEQRIAWGHKLESAKHHNGATTLDFSSVTAEADLVIGADGTWSRIRPLLSSIKPKYSGLQNITITIPKVAEFYPDLSEFCGPGSAFVLGNRNAIIAQRGTGDSERLYLTINTCDEELEKSENFENLSPEAISERLTNDDRYFGDWSETAKTLIRTAFIEDARPDSWTLDIRPLYTLPTNHTWDSKRGLAMIGDAAHVMTPYAGEGVNLAMWDALDLAAVIAEAWSTDMYQFQNDLSPKLQEVTELIIERSNGKAKGTQKNAEIIFADNAAEKMASLMKMLAARTQKNA